MILTLLSFSQGSTSSHRPQRRRLNDMQDSETYGDWDADYVSGCFAFCSPFYLSFAQVPDSPLNDTTPLPLAVSQPASRSGGDGNSTAEESGVCLLLFCLLVLSPYPC